MTFDIHVGLRRGYGLSYGGPGQLINDGDGWNAWGEKPSTDANDLTTRHIIYRVSTLGKAIDAAVEILDGTSNALKAMDPSKYGGGTVGEGDLVVVTDSDDWAKVYFTINEEYGMRTHNGVVKED